MMDFEAEFEKENQPVKIETSIFSLDMNRQLGGRLPTRALQLAKGIAEEENSYGLRTKVEHLLRIKTPEAAEKILQKSKLAGSEYSWNKVIKYYAMLGEYKQAENTYQQVCPLEF